MKAELWVNEFGDSVVFVGDEYVIYDKVDRLGAEVMSMNKHRRGEHTDIEKVKLAYYKNGFRPLPDGKESKWYDKCGICQYRDSCCSGEGNSECCTCKQGRKCPDQKCLKDNFKLSSMEDYANRLHTEEKTDKSGGC